MKKCIKYLMYILIVSISIIVDIITKNLVEGSITLGDSKVIIPNFLKITYIHNEGAAFGIFKGQTIYLILFSLLVVVFILYQFYSYRKSTFICISFSLLLGGLIGNLIDRISLGFVRDFIDFNIFKYDAPIFNVSDMCIVISILMILYGVYKFEGVDKNVKPIDYAREYGQETGSDASGSNGQDKKQHNKTYKTRTNKSK